MSVLKKFCLDNPDPVAISKALLKIEPTGVLAREICYHSVPLDGEDSGKMVIPPRLFLITSHFLLVHAYGDDVFYDLSPEYERGGLSKECYVLKDTPRYLSNYFAMEDLYAGTGVIAKAPDPLSLSERRPPPMTATQRSEWLKQRRREIRERDRKLLGLTVVR